MVRKSRHFRAFILFWFCCQSLMPAAARGDEIIARLKRLVFEAPYEGVAPNTGKDGSMECLAKHIDWLEHHIDTYGSVVAKQPDIWGEARLTKHRDEYERVLFKELGGFGDTINAAISQSDSAFLAQALSLSAVAAGGTPSTGVAAASNAPAKAQVGTVTAQLADATNTDQKLSFNQFGVADSTKQTDLRLKLEPTLHLDQLSRYINHLHELRRINEGDDTSDAPGYSLNLVRIPVSILPGKLTRQGFGAEITITAEPVISDDLMPTTFQNLAINDAVDLLGLPLVRVTERLIGFDARDSRDAFQKTESKLMFLFNQHLDEVSFIEQASPEIATYFKYPIGVNILIQNFEETLERLKSTGFKSLENSEPTAIVSTKPVYNQQYEMMRMQAYNSIITEQTIKNWAGPKPEENRSENSAVELVNNVLVALKNEDADGTAKALYRMAMRQSNLGSKFPSINVEVMQVTAVHLQQLLELGKYVAIVSPSGRARRALNPLNPSSLEDVVGIKNLLVVSRFFEKAYYGEYTRWNGGRGQYSDNCEESRVNLLDARRFLNAETKAAHELLCQPDHLPLFAQLAQPQSLLAQQIRNGHLREGHAQRPSVEAYRHYFFQELHKHSAPHLTEWHSDAPVEHYCHMNSDALTHRIFSADMSAEANSSVEALAWVLVVESALLNEQLNMDVRKLAKAKQAIELDTDRDYCFFLPDAVTSPGKGMDYLQSEFQAATEVFKNYVTVRWPIHVFAVDPVDQEQNVADVSQRLRELQFALALGFASGRIGLQSLTQYSRDLRTQVETISLNKTVVGFGHGTDTFGWRFFPRVQALQAGGTLSTIRETIMGTPRDYDLCHRQIEPGQRECVAIVLMPSFVPYADFDIRSDWFKLTNPKNTALTMKDSLELSRAVTAMRNSRANCAQCQHLYREGELRRLFKRVDQLDRELPLQTMRSQIPYENTLGGFEMFNTGVTDLAPELIGWYGAPGINPNNTNCGCFVGCVAPLGGCKDPKECAALNTALTDLNNTVASTPIPACEGPGTTLFLVGDNFSVHDTKVIAGGVCIPHVRIISRELLQVTIPHCANTVQLCVSNGVVKPYVAVYVATPYGVTNHLHVPVIVPPSTAGTPCSTVTQQTSPSLLHKAPSHEVSILSERLDRSARLTSWNQPSTEPPVEEQISKLHERFDVLEKEILAISNRGQVSAVDLRLSIPSANAPQEKRRCDISEFPTLNRFKTQLGETWRNCRDQLPCN